MKNKKVNFIIVLFFGVVGVHKFMDKKIKQGLLYMFTVGLFGIGWIIDVVKALNELIKENGSANNQLKKTYEENVNKTENHILEIDNNIRESTKTALSYGDNSYKSISKEKKEEFQKKYFSHNLIIKKIGVDEAIDLNTSDVIVFDVETTGLSPNEGHRIIEISLLKYDGGVLTDKYVSLLNPGFRLPLRIIDLTRINNEDLVDKPSFRDVVNDVIDFMNNSIIVGHNISFDLNFLKSEIFKCPFDTKTMSIKYIDTLELARKSIYGTENYKLETLKDYFGIDVPSHRAENDCIATFEVYKRCLHILVDKKNREEKMAVNYKKRVEERTNNMNDDERSIIDFFLKTAKLHDKVVEYHFMSDKSICFTLCGIEIGRIKYNGRKRYCKLYAGDSRKHKWENVDNPKLSSIFEYIEDLFNYIDKTYKSYFLKYGDK